MASRSAIRIDRDLEPDVNYKSSRPGPPYGGVSDFRDAHENINLFFKALYQENNMHRLDSVFSHIADWEEFYAAFRKEDHDRITKFAFLVHKVKDVPGEDKWLDSSLVFTLAKAALYHQENPYRIPREALKEEAFASNSPS